MFRIPGIEKVEEVKKGHRNVLNLPTKDYNDCLWRAYQMCEYYQSIAVDLDTFGSSQTLHDQHYFLEEAYYHLNHKKIMEEHGYPKNITEGVSSFFKKK